MIKILTLILLKNSLQNAIRLEIFPISLIIYLPQMYWECRRRRVALISMRGCSSLVSQYHNTDVWTFLKLMMIIEHIKMMQTPHLDICRCFFPDKCVIGVTQVTCFGILKTLSWFEYYPIGGKKLTNYYWLAFFINWFQCRMLGIICCIYM